VATIAVTFTSPQGSLSRTLDLSDAAMARVIAAYKLWPGGGVNRTGWTNAQIANGLVGDFGQMIRTMVKTVERSEAEKAAAVAAIDID
jgi:hypothetical protein